MQMGLHHWVMLVVIVFVGYWLGERYPNMLKSIPAIGQFT